MPNLLTGSRTTRRKPDRAVGPLLAALGDGTRQDIIERLRAGPRTVGELSALLPVSRPAVSQHLKILRDAGLIQGQIDGPRVCYCANPAKLQELKRLIAELESLTQNRSKCDG